MLIIGERGTGEELIASRLHYLSSVGKAIYFLNCAALNENILITNCLVTRSGGVYQCAKTSSGRFERASGGQLFLDELATAPMMVQEKLLRIINR
ncbi:sigma 54-interacting transcriptional regulator [Shigella flexneri]